MSNLNPTPLFTRDGSPYTGPVTPPEGRQRRPRGVVKQPCCRCGGQGGWRGWPGFTCFRCGGQCWDRVVVTLYTREEVDRLLARDAQKLAALQAAAAAHQAEREAAAAQAEAERAAAQAERDRQRQERNARSQPQGTVGKRLTLSLQVLVLRDFDGRFGTSYWHLLKDQAGNLYTYKGGTWLGDPGDQVDLTATVASHETYQGAHQTALARPRVQVVAPEPEPEPEPVVEPDQWPVPAWAVEPDPPSILATPADAMREYAANLADEDPQQCACHGSGWVLTDYDTHVRCPIHPAGPHPEDQDWHDAPEPDPVAPKPEPVVDQLHSHDAQEWAAHMASGYPGTTPSYWLAQWDRNRWEATHCPACGSHRTIPRRDCPECGPQDLASQDLAREVAQAERAAGWDPRWV